MDINGSVNAAELEFTIELDTDEVWEEITDGANEIAYEVAREAAREEIQNADFGIDYGEGARNLLNEYNPGLGCSLARDFERAVQGAVGVDGFLAEAIKEAVNETAVTAVNPAGVRAMVREEIRLALTSVAGQMTSVV